MQAIVRFGSQPRKSSRVFYQCGICDHYHPAAWDGDCRDDSNRYAAEDLPEGWVEVSQPE